MIGLPLIIAFQWQYEANDLPILKTLTTLLKSFAENCGFTQTMTPFDREATEWSTVNLQGVER